MIISQQPADPVASACPGRVCLVTDVLAELTPACERAQLASGRLRALAEAGWPCTVLFAGPIDPDSDHSRLALHGLSDRNIAVLLLQQKVSSSWMATPRRRSYACFWVLRALDFDLILFDATGGLAFYAARARDTGAALAGSVVAIAANQLTAWAMQTAQTLLHDAAGLELELLERCSLECADVVTLSSERSLAWLGEAGIALPQRRAVLRDPLPQLHPVLRFPLGPGALREIAYLGPIGTEGGLACHLAALRRVAPRLPDVRFSFLGRFARHEGGHGGAALLEALSDLPNLIDIRDDLDRDRLCRHLARPGVLAVVPVADASASVAVRDAAAAGQNLLAAAAGAMPELLPPAHLVAPTVEAWAEALLRVARDGLSPAAPMLDEAALAPAFVAGLAALCHEARRARDHRLAAIEGPAPLVSVIVTHHNRPTLLPDLLAAIAAQDHKALEVILVDDGSTHPDSEATLAGLERAAHPFPLTMLRLPHGDVGPARNAGAARASGVFLKFQDDDNLPMAHEIATLVRAAQLTQADVVTAMPRFFTRSDALATPPSLDEMRYLSLGASLPLSVLRNELGDANCLIRRETFTAEGGFDETPWLGWEDYRLLLRLESRGVRIASVPEPCFHYRQQTDSVMRTRPAYTAAAFARGGLTLSDQPWLRELIRFTQETAQAVDQDWAAEAGAATRRAPELQRALLRASRQDPNGAEAREAFLALAAAYERLEDVLPMLLRGGTLAAARARLAWAEAEYDRYAQARAALPTRPILRHFHSLDGMTQIEPGPDSAITADWRCDPDGSMLVHPMTGVINRVHARSVLPAGTSRVVVPLSHRNALGHPCRMEVTVERPDGATLSSGWIDLSPGGRAEAIIAVDPPLAAAAALTVAAAVDGPPHAAWAHADRIEITAAPPPAAR